MRSIRAGLVLLGLFCWCNVWIGDFWGIWGCFWVLGVREGDVFFDFFGFITDNISSLVKTGRLAKLT